jgi:2-succinyl-6-hydroxy-2,4-cyclohexadiene-1-carboxylate synthase
VSAFGEARLVNVRGIDYRAHLTPPVRRSRHPVVLIHGFAGSSEDWAEVAARLDRGGWPVIAIDLPGHGGTEAPHLAQRFTLEDTILDLRFILTALHVVLAHWVGYSMGGRIALGEAIRHGGRMVSLTLESTSPGIENAEERAERRQSDLALARDIESRGVAWFADFWTSQPIFATQRALPAPVREAQRGRRLQNHAAGLTGSLRGVGQGVQPYLGYHLREVTCRTLVLSGELDPKYGGLGAQMAGALSHARHVVVPGAGHNIHLEQPEAFAGALLDHLERAESGPSAAPRAAT